MKEFICPSKNESDEFMYLKGNLMRIKLNKLGLYAGQPIMLAILSDNPGLTQKSLSDIAGIKPSTVNVMLNRMAKNNLVEIKKDENNSRFSRVYITEVGKKFNSEAQKVKLDIEEIQYKNLNEQEKEIFVNILKKINKNLKSEMEGEIKADENN